MRLELNYLLLFVQEIECNCTIYIDQGVGKSSNRSMVLLSDCIETGQKIMSQCHRCFFLHLTRTAAFWG